MPTAAMPVAGARLFWPPLSRHDLTHDASFHAGLLAATAHFKHTPAIAEPRITEDFAACCCRQGGIRQDMITTLISMQEAAYMPSQMAS